jgi:hypothetical protein
MATPYITPGMLTSAPAGISWKVVPTLTADSAEQLAQLDQVCWRATSIVDSYCRQPLRATANTETATGPGAPRVAVDRHTGMGLLVTQYSPVVEVLGVLVAPSRSFPPQWCRVPDDHCRIRHPAPLSAGPAPVTTPAGGNAIDLAPSHLDWRHGRSGWQVQYSYLSGWPHTSLTADTQAGDTTVQVDDVTGWTGAVGFAYDGPGTEPVQATAAAATVPVELPNGAGTVDAGPGTVTLAAPLTAGHPAGTVISAMPTAVIQATLLLATVQALEGLNAIAVQSMSGRLAGGLGPLATEAEMILDDYRRVI